MIIVGLGNPGEKYVNTRHNAGEVVLRRLAKYFEADDFVTHKHAEIALGKIGKEKTSFVFPTTFMNDSGKAVKPLVTSKKDLAKLIVIQDELDLPVGRMKCSFGKNSGGHRGIESIIQTLKSKEFFRVRVGISPGTPSGKLKKPSGEKAVLSLILGKFKPSEETILAKQSKKVAETLEILATKGKEAAMSFGNS